MSKLKDLIAELCPHGVEFKPLGELCEFRAGWGFPEKEQGKKNETYPFYKVSDMNNSEMFMDIANNYISEETAKKLKCKPAPKDTIIFPKIGAAMSTNKKRILTKKACYDNNIMGLIAKSIDAKFLFYCFSRYKLIELAKGTGAVPSLDTNKLKQIKIPVPPLPVQNEIVRMLDTFTELIATLEAELKLRKIQYEYYRDKLLTFENVPMVKLGEIAECKNIKNKGQKCKLAYSITKIGLIPTDKYFKDSKTKITSDNTSGYKIVKKNWFVYSPSRIDVGSINFLKDAEEVIVSPLDVVFSANETKILPAFLLYYLLSHNGMFQILNHRHGIEGTGRKLLPFEDFARIKIPLPPLEEQERIVNILDKFDKLCNDLCEGIPAEIAARKKQYEYYRDLLLTFEEEFF